MRFKERFVHHKKLINHIFSYCFRIENFRELVLG